MNDNDKHCNKNDHNDNNTEKDADNDYHEIMTVNDTNDSNDETDSNAMPGLIWVESSWILLQTFQGEWGWMVGA